MELADSATAGNAASAEAAATVRHAAMILLREATDALEWQSPTRDETRDGATRSFSVRGLHTYGSRLAMLIVVATSDEKPTVDLRVTCELADFELFNAERIVRIEAAADDEVQEWVQTQLGRAVNALLSRVRAR